MVYKKISMLLLVCILLSCNVRAESGSVLFNNGISEFQKGRYQDAIFWFTKLIEKEPFNAKAYKNRGVARLSLQKYDTAIENYNTALNPASDINAVDKTVALGPAWHHKATYQKAMEDFNSALNLDPDLEGIYSNIGVAWYYEQEYDKAVAAYNKEIEKHPENYSAFFNRALSWVQLNAYDNALKDLEIVLSIKPGEYWALVYQGDIHAERKNWAAARHAYQTAINSDPEHPYARKKLLQIDALAAVDAQEDVNDDAEPQNSLRGEAPTVQTSVVKPVSLSSRKRRTKTGMKAHSTPEPNFPDSSEKLNNSSDISRETGKNVDPGTISREDVDQRTENQTYTIQLGAFLNRSNAAELINVLEKENIAVRVVQIKDKKKREWSLVRTGDFPSVQAAAPILEALKTQLKRDAVVRPVGQF